MRITIHRGTDQIGGCVTEYECKGWRLFVDYGEQLPGTSKSDKSLEIEGLTYGDLSKSALLITHYHSDHIGKIAELPAELPIYMGEIAKEIQFTYSNHVSKVDEKNLNLAERLKSVLAFAPGKAFGFGPFTIIPIVIDHSAFDAYAFKIEAEKLKVFHSGDFRTHGFRSGKLSKVIDTFIGRVDYVVCEATNVDRTNSNNTPTNVVDSTLKSERELQKEFEEAFRENKCNVVYLSSTNIDRLFSLYRAALNAGRPFYVDSYQKRIMDIVVGRDHIWGKSKFYKYKEGKEPIELHREGNSYKINEKFKDYLSKRGYVLIARSGDRFDNLIAKMPDEGRCTYLSMWDGYVDKSKPTYSPSLAKSVGDKYTYLHTSGHCDMKSLDELITMLNPKAIIPIHTDAPQCFADKFCEKWPVLLLKDGDSFTPVRDPGYDTITARIYALKEPDESQVEANPLNLPWWKIDEKKLGEFKSEEEAYKALTYAVYAPERLLAYVIEIDEDSDPFKYVIYNPDLTFHSEYRYGGHAPEGSHYKEESGFQPGDKVICLMYEGIDAIFPGVIVGPMTEEYLRNVYETDEDMQISYSSAKEAIEDWTDWNWDTVIVKPLIRFKSTWGELGENFIIPRLYLFS